MSSTAIESITHYASEREQRFAERLRHMSEIGLALSAVRDIDRLLELILEKSRELTEADAGSLFMVEDAGTADTGDDTLYFRKAYNDSVTVSTDRKFSVSSGSLAGYVAMSGNTLFFDDVYHLPADAPYRFNSAFDHEIGYRTKSVLVLPLKTHDGKIIGVLQLINRKRHREVRLSSPDAVEAEVLPFDGESREVAASLASQASIALENHMQQREIRLQNAKILALLQDIELLFESFVTASTRAIEDRDPCTAGHSFRVTNMTLGLASAVDRATEGSYKDVFFSEQQMKELRYAGLLHDFGKIGVRENVLTKSHKLEPLRFDVVKSRLALVRLAREAEFANRRTQVALEAPSEQRDARMNELACELRNQLQEIDGLVGMLEHANDPAVTFLPDDDYARQQDLLTKLASLKYEDDSGQLQPIIASAEFEALSIRKGSLTVDEYKQIQRHAELSYKFLQEIRWTAGYGDVPYIAACHHEKLNGKGYPEGRTAEQIPLTSRMMTVADIYDALTAADRPYKKAMKVEMALQILQWEADQGGLDPDLVKLFRDEKVYEVSQSRDAFDGLAPRAR